jgi:hypothetical protein
MKSVLYAAKTDNGQSEVLGVVLLIGIAVVVTVVAAVTGFAALDQDQTQIGTEQAEQSLSQFDKQSSSVALGQSDGATVDFGLPSGEGTMAVRPDTGWIRVNYRDLTGKRDPNQATVANVTLGSLAYTHDGETVGYQGGGVFRSAGNGSVLVSRPEFRYNDGTLTTPIIVTDGETAGVSDVQIQPNGTVRRFPAPSRNLTNQVENTTVVVTVKSRYYEAWAEFFSRYTPGIVSTDATAKTASVQFVSLPERTGVVGGVVATAESGDLSLVGTGTYVDSYNSSEDPYSLSQDANGKVKTVGNIEISADATINATARSGDDIRVEESSSVINGDAEHTDKFVNDGTVTGNSTNISGVPTIVPIDTFVLTRLQDTQNINNNSEVTTDFSRVGRDERVELNSGRYYTETLDVSGGTLVLNTSDGNISLGVQNWISVTKDGGDGGNITVKGDGVVKLYLGSQSDNRVSFTGSGTAPTRDVNLFVGKDSTVYVPGDVAPRFRVFAPQETDVAVAGSGGGNATFHGLVYAPDGLSLSGSAYVKQADVYGGVVAGEVTLGQYGAVHFDEQLKNLPLPRATRVSDLEYLHTAVHRQNVTATSVTHD